MLGSTYITCIMPIIKTSIMPVNGYNCNAHTHTHAQTYTYTQVYKRMIIIIHIWARDITTLILNPYYQEYRNLNKAMI